MRELYDADPVERPAHPIPLRSSFTREVRLALFEKRTATLSIVHGLEGLVYLFTFLSREWRTVEQPMDEFLVPPVHEGRAGSDTGDEIVPVLDHFGVWPDPIDQSHRESPLGIHELPGEKDFEYGCRAEKL